MAEKLEWMPVWKIPITPEVVENTKSRCIRVTNRLNLEDLSDLYAQPSASYKAASNSVLALLDEMFRRKSVPSWVIGEPITSDTEVNPEKVALERIRGVETLLQINHWTPNPNAEDPLKREPCYIDNFSHSIRLIRTNGEEQRIETSDLSKLRLADYKSIQVGFVYTLVPASQREIIRKWRERWAAAYHTLPKGEVSLREVNEKGMEGVFDILNGENLITQEAISYSEHELEGVYLSNGKQADKFPVRGDSLIAVADKRLIRRGIKGIYKVTDTYIDGELDKRNNIYILSVPGLERAVLEIEPFCDPRDIGILLEIPHPIKGIAGRTESGKGRKAANEVTVEPGMSYFVVATLQGVYDRSDFSR